MDDVPWHYLRRNHASRYPRRVVCFDTESAETATASGVEHAWRCGYASFDRIDPATKRPASTERKAFERPADLLDWLEAKAVKKERTIVYAHSLAFDLRVGRILDLVTDRGWQLDFITLDSARCVARLTKDGRSLTFTDSMSWLPRSLGEIASMVGMQKPPLPRDDDELDSWMARCATDVEILRAAVLELMCWLEESDLGNWRITGPAQAMAAYRHRFMRDGLLLVHRDEEAIEAERRAAWSGRCELFRHGKVDERVEEWDFTLAYLTIARSALLPCQLRGTTGPLSVAKFRQLAKRGRVLVDVEISSEHPTVPAAMDDRTVWPVGRFTTTLWDVELEAAIERGAEVTITRAWLYWQAPILADWAEWLLAQLSAGEEGPSALVRVMLKHWARCLIGRFGVRYPDWAEAGTMPEATVAYEPCLDVDTGEDGANLYVGHQWLERVGMSEGRDSMPAVMSCVMALARVRLLHAIEAAGWPHVVYVDTDSLLVTRKGVQGLRAFAASDEGAGLRCKGAYRSTTLKAPRQIALDDAVRASGVPRAAVKVSDGVFRADVWEGLGQSLRRGSSSTVAVNDRTFRLRGNDRRRKHHRDGSTSPHRLGT